MGRYLTSADVKIQSENALKQWGPRWEANSEINGKVYRRNPRDHKDLLYTGMGKTMLLVAMGTSFQKAVDVIKKHKDKVEVGCVDKAFKFLMQNGIKPKYVFAADAMINYENYAKEFINDTEDVTLVMNVCGNTDWPKYWQGPVFFYVNKDNICTEKKFGNISGVKQMIPASSNVGNTAVVFSTQIFGYDQYLLIGYDFSWRRDENYYAFHDHYEKRCYMKHHSLIDNQNEFVETSSNLFFSARWLAEYANQLGVLNPRCPIKNCSYGVMMGAVVYDLERQLELAETRKLTDAQKLELLTAHRQVTRLTQDQFKNLESFLNDKRIEPLDVAVSYVNKEVADYVRAN